MHELSLAVDLIEQITKICNREKVTRILSVKVSIGAMSGVEREPMEFAFPEAARGTLAEDAVFEIEEVPLRVNCRACGADTECVPHLLRCEKCLDAAVDIISGRDFLLTGLEVL